MTLPVMPNPKVQFFDDNGNPLVGGKLYSYESGTSTPKATYTTAEGTTANANPVILDSRGEAAVFLSGRYKLILKDSDDAQIWSVDDVSMMPYTTIEQSEWIDQSLTLTYSSATVFTVPSDQTAAFVAGRRIKAIVSAGTIYGVIKTSAYTTLTTVTCVWDSGSLDSGLSDISLGLIMPTNTGYPNLYALPRYTTTQRDALTAGAGMMIYNSTLGQVEAYYDSAWMPFTASLVYHYQTGAVATGTTVIPNDDTIPQNTEGDEYMTLAITPKATTNTLLIDITILLSHSATNGTFTVALFQDATANAIAATQEYSGGVAGAIRSINFRHKMTAGTTSSTTFKVRAGGGTAGTTTFNGQLGARSLGGVLASSITITECKTP